MPNLRGSEWLIIILLVVLLFGAKRLPDAARSVGRSLRIFKAETKGLVDDGASPAGAQAPQGSTAPSTTPPSAAPAAPAALPPADPAAPPSGIHDPATPALHPQSGGTPSALNPQPPTQA